MSIKLYRLTTGEDVVGAPQEKEHTTTHTAIKKPFVLIPIQGKPGENTRIGFQPYIPYSEDEIIMIKKDNIICTTNPGENILKAYESNTTNLVQPDTKLIM
jgi:hypothetical protein|tara:strand:- start:96 stop:398 length:303 start_codon:yes stop_codon:yes gene_type:complete